MHKQNKRTKWKRKTVQENKIKVRENEKNLKDKRMMFILTKLHHVIIKT